jgi:uncharacterized C2H2 Zn-finger protein
MTSSPSCKHCHHPSSPSCHPECKHCNRFFKSAGQHNYEYHSEVVLSVVGVTKTVMRGDNNLLKCPLCGNLYETRSGFQKHVLTHDGVRIVTGTYSKRTKCARGPGMPGPGEPSLPLSNKKRKSKGSDGTPIEFML